MSIPNTDVKLTIEAELSTGVIPIDDPPGAYWVHLIETYDNIFLYKQEGPSLDATFSLPDGEHPNPGGGVGYYTAKGYRATSLGAAVGPVVEVTFDIITTFRDELVAKAITESIV